MNGRPMHALFVEPAADRGDGRVLVARHRCAPSLVGDHDAWAKNLYA